MKISKKSWHYKLNNYLFKKDQEYIESLKYYFLKDHEVKDPQGFMSLCGYFWYTLGNIFLFIFFIISNILLYKIPKTKYIFFKDYDIALYKNLEYGIFFIFSFASFLAFGVASYILASVLSDLIALFFLPLIYGKEIFNYLLTDREIMASFFVALGVIMLLLLFLAFEKSSESIILETIKAKAKNICPMITFKD